MVHILTQDNYTVSIHIIIFVFQILESIIIDLLDLKDAPQDPQQACDVIKKKLSSRYTTDIFLVIHNIDGTALRGNKQQSVLAQLAMMPKVHIVASIDHINAPLCKYYCLYSFIGHVYKY